MSGAGPVSGSRVTLAPRASAVTCFAGLAWSTPPSNRMRHLPSLDLCQTVSHWPWASRGLPSSVQVAVQGPVSTPTSPEEDNSAKLGYQASLVLLGLRSV